VKLKSGMPGILIPYKSGAEAVTAVAGDQILFAIADGAAVVPMVQSGTVRALAVLGSERFAGLP